MFPALDSQENFIILLVQPAVCQQMCLVIPRLL